MRNRGKTLKDFYELTMELVRLLNHFPRGLERQKGGLLHRVYSSPSRALLKLETPTCKSVEALGPDGLADLLVSYACGVSGQNWSVPLPPALGQDAEIVFI